MKKCVLLLFLLIMLQGLHAQQTQQNTQYIFNHFGYNPAVAGSRQCIDIRLGGRQQWWGMEGSPLTFWGSIFGRIARPKKTFAKGYHGIGLYMQRDDQGPVSRTTFYPAYAYHIRLNGRTHLGMGVFAGLQQYRFDRSRLIVPEPGDPALLEGGSVFIVPDVSAGLWMYNKRTYLGLSALQAWRKRIDGFGEGIGSEAVLTPHFHLTGGFQVEGNDEYFLVPSFMLKYTPLSAPSLDLNAMFNYRRTFAIGLSYRNFDAVAALARIRLLNFVNLGYSFDFTTSTLKYGSSNTHEVTLSFYLCGKSGGGDDDIYTCPAYQ